MKKMIRRIAALAVLTTCILTTGCGRIGSGIYQGAFGILAEKFRAALEEAGLLDQTGDTLSGPSVFAEGGEQAADGQPGGSEDDGFGDYLNEIEIEIEMKESEQAHFD